MWTTFFNLLTGNCTSAISYWKLHISKYSYFKISSAFTKQFTLKPPKFGHQNFNHQGFKSFEEPCGFFGYLWARCDIGGSWGRASATPGSPDQGITGEDLSLMESLESRNVNDKTVGATNQEIFIVNMFLHVQVEHFIYILYTAIEVNDERTKEIEREMTGLFSARENIIEIHWFSRETWMTFYDFVCGLHLPFIHSLYKSRHIHTIVWCDAWTFS